MSMNTAHAELIDPADRPSEIPTPVFKGLIIPDEFNQLEPASEISPSLPTNNQNQALETFKSAYAKVTNEIIKVIDTVEVSLAAIPVPGNATCETDISMQTLENYLVSQNSQVQSAESLEDIKLIIAETVTYLKENKDTITSSANSYIDCAYKATLTVERSFLAASKAQANVLKIKGTDVTKVLEDIFAASALVDQSEDIYNSATTNQKKAEAFKVLADTVPYLQSINTALYV